jgi:hypothetical protein
VGARVRRRPLQALLLLPPVRLPPVNKITECVYVMSVKNLLWYVVPRYKFSWYTFFYYFLPRPPKRSYLYTPSVQKYKMF